RPFSCIATLATELLAVVRPHLDRPFALFGHSMGALIAFELARRMQHAGVQPRLLIASASAAPSVRRHRDRVSEMSEDAFVERIRSLNGAPPEVLLKPATIRRFLRTLRSDIGAVERYEYVSEEPLACPIVAFGGDQDDVVRRADVAAWQAHTSDA